MKTITTAIAGTVLALSLGNAPAVAQKARTSASPRPSGAPPMAMDVAGVRLGMALAGVRSVLAGTYRCERPYAVPSFRQMVDGEVQRRRGAGAGFGADGTAVGQFTCTGPSAEHLRLFMAQTPSGEVVDRIDLTVRTDRVDAASLVRQVEGKYGRPSEGTAANGSWCSSRCGYDLSMEPEPRITTMSAGDRFQILASRGRTARLADEAAVRAAADRQAPPAKRGAF